MLATWHLTAVDVTAKHLLSLRVQRRYLVRYLLHRGASLPLIFLSAWITLLGSRMKSREDNFSQKRSHGMVAEKGKWEAMSGSHSITGKQPAATAEYIKERTPLSPVSKWGDAGWVCRWVGWWWRWWWWWSWW